MPTKQAIIQALDTFIRQRPGLEFGNYGDRKAYAAEVRSIGKDLRDARALLHEIELRTSISAEDILEHATGRLSIVVEGDEVRVDYTTGQYWPTEYRPAVARLCASVLWSQWSTDANNASDIRRIAARELGRGIAGRWFR